MSEAAAVAGEASPRGASLVELLCAPRSVVVVGASADLTSPAGRPLAYLDRFGFEGRLQVVNRRVESVAGLPTIASIGELEPGSAEVAIVNIPARFVPEAIAELDERGVRAAICIASGFEDEAEGEPRSELRKVLADSAIRVIGPNCVGTMSVAAASYLTFSSVLQTREPKAGGAALVTQSGALGNSLLLSLLTRGAGLSTWFSTGDEIDTGALELIEGLLRRDEVSGVGLFLEGFTDVDNLAAAAAAIEATGKPVFAMKGAKTDLGRLAAGGHTGRVVGGSDVSRAMLAEAGITEVGSLEELADALVCLDLFGRPRGGRVGVVSISGGSGVIAADTVQESPTLELADLDEAGVAEGERLDERIAPSNPLDVPFLGETATFTDSVRKVARRAGVDAVVTVESHLAHEEAELVEGLVADGGSPVPTIVTYLCSDDPLSEAGVARLAEAGIATVPTPARSILALSRLAPDPASGADTDSASDHHAAATGSDPTAASDHPAGGAMLGLEAIAALPGGGRVPWAQWRIAATAEEAGAALGELGEPVVVKAAGRTLAHRSELGAVKVGIDAAGMAAAFAAVDAVSREHGDATLVQEMSAPGFELMVAVIADPEFGPVAFVRPGGVLAELLDQQVILSNRWPRATRLRRLRESRLGEVLSGYRGGESYDLGALVDLVADVVDLVPAGDLSFLELNPVILAPDGATAVDAVGAARRD
jgi:acetate---CoA ligase (ADP-forming)